MSGNEGEFELGPAERFMARAVVVLESSQPIGQAARELERHGVSGAPVVEDGRVVGTVSLRRLFSAGGVHGPSIATEGPWHRYETLLNASGVLVRDAMQRERMTASPTTSMVQVAGLMLEHGLDRVPIVDSNGQIQGIVAREDVLRAVASLADRGPLTVQPERPLLVPD